MAGFMIVWLGQIISVLASSMTGFGMTLWMYKQTGSATAMAGMQVAFITPFLLLSPIAGVLVDRYNRKLMMMVSDLMAVLSTAGIFVLYASGNLQYWHLYIAAVINGLGNTFQWPAYSAAISTMLPKEQYGRANGLMSLLDAGPGVFAPLLAGIILALPMTKPFDSFALIMLLDVLTFFIAIGALLFVYIPQPEKTVEGQQESGSIWRESVYGFKYIFKRPSLLGLQMIFFIGNSFSGMGFTLLAPMVLARTAQNSLIFGSVQTAGAVGGVIGGVIMSAWSGFKRKVHGVLLGWLMSGVFFAMLGVGQGLTVWIPFMVLMVMVSPLVNSSNQAIWQSKVAPDVQGRVFSARRLIAWFTQPIAPIIAGVLADYVMEPSMQVNSGLSRLFGGLFGTGPGAGMGLLVFFSGMMAALVGLSGYFFRPIRDAESILPDHDQLARVEET
ncbi:MAG: macrolide transporter [Chloroflexi bacterium GWB2_49_20]|nr:MAG: macrolide transporter [Chloroflexi bacterium GWB2_49_20]OGN79653.1 MAG: macrolide transporter [Chloroflexi bacterium GWC2_49_37]OGN84625.1 MAG: macrolide transporter [Chloroflexi bacterium GWD2_49_16]HCC79297.1 MFS transporter [Anaerolineae bacterium]HCM97217.1 MFS transporter [Anaerolineae bacterium]